LARDSDSNGCTDRRGNEPCEQSKPENIPRDCKGVLSICIPVHEVGARHSFQHVPTGDDRHQRSRRRKINEESSKKNGWPSPITPQEEHRQRDPGWYPKGTNMLKMLNRQLTEFCRKKVTAHDERKNERILKSAP
jgi:hypothetical protein